MALHGSSFVINFLIAVIGIAGIALRWTPLECGLYIAAGCGGAIATYWLWRVFNDRVQAVARQGE
jgi:hypothetical protein